MKRKISKGETSLHYWRQSVEFAERARTPPDSAGGPDGPLTSLCQYPDPFQALEATDEGASKPAMLSLSCYFL